MSCGVIHSLIFAFHLCVLLFVICAVAKHEVQSSIIISWYPVHFSCKACEHLILGWWFNMHVTCKRVTILTSASARYTAVLQGRELLHQLKLCELHCPRSIAGANYVILRNCPAAFFDEDDLLARSLFEESTTIRQLCIWLPQAFWSSTQNNFRAVCSQHHRYRTNANWRRLAWLSLFLVQPFCDYF